MDFNSFKKSVNDEYPSPGVNGLLKAMWYTANNEWNAAHRIAQENDSIYGSWVHAYLHREEGDTGNASYWYAQAGKMMPETSLESEWDEITKELIEKL